MKVIAGIIKIGATIFLVNLFFSSCILDEFNADKIRMKEEWDMEIVTPLFRGSFEFKDLVHDWDSVHFQSDEQFIFFKTSENYYLKLPSRIIFEPTTIIDNFSFLINGNYGLSKVYFEYTVSNGCPFPLNFETQFYEKTNPNQPGPPILPPLFIAANSEGGDFIPVETKHLIELTDNQLQSFLTSNRIKFSTWFNSTELINTTDTFLANYPVKLSIIFYGEVQRKNED